MNVPPSKSEHRETNLAPASFVDSIDLEQFDLEAQSGVWWDDWWKTASSVPEVRRHNKLGLFTKRKLGNTLVPTLDYLADTDLSDKGVSSISAGIELLSVGEGSYIMDRDGITTLGEGCAISRGNLFDCNAHGEDEKMTAAEETTMDDDGEFI